MAANYAETDRVGKRVWGSGVVFNKFPLIQFSEMSTLLLEKCYNQRFLRKKS